MDEHSHHEIKKGDFQVSKRVNSIYRQKGRKGGMAMNEIIKGRDKHVPSIVDLY